jgi:hypothetical protein
LAQFGRYVDIGRREVLDHGGLNMNMFANHASFFSFDLGIIGWQKPEIFQRYVILQQGTIIHARAKAFGMKTLCRGLQAISIRKNRAYLPH